MKGAISIFSLFFITGILISCNYTRLKEPKDSGNQKFGDLRTEEKLTKMNYSFINSKIIEPKCVSCHGTSGDVNLETYASIKSNLLKIEQTVFIEETMPKRGTLSFEEKLLLWNWIRMGAPLESPEPPPEEEPMIATYESIRSHIIEPKCATCHNPKGTANRISLDWQALLDSPLELVLPGNADESGLIIALERKDNKRMPPAEEGYSALKPEEILIIREWIANGAK